MDGAGVLNRGVEAGPDPALRDPAATSSMPTGRRGNWSAASNWSTAMIFWPRGQPNSTKRSSVLEPGFHSSMNSFHRSRVQQKV